MFSTKFLCHYLLTRSRVLRKVCAGISLFQERNNSRIWQQLSKQTTSDVNESCQRLAICSIYDVTRLDSGNTDHLSLLKKLISSLWAQSLNDIGKIQSTALACMCVLSCLSYVWLIVTLCTVAHQLPWRILQIIQAKILEWVAMTSSRGSSQLRYRTPISYICCIGGQVLYH